MWKWNTKEKERIRDVGSKFEEAGLCEFEVLTLELKCDKISYCEKKKKHAWDVGEAPT